MTYLLSTSKITHLPQEAEWTPSTEVDRRFGLSCYPFGDSNRSLVTLTGQAHTHRTLHTVLHNLKQVAPPLILVDDASWNNKSKLLQLMFCGSRRSRLFRLQGNENGHQLLPELWQNRAWWQLYPHCAAASPPRRLPLWCPLIPRLPHRPPPLLHNIGTNHIDIIIWNNTGQLYCNNAIIYFKIN